MNINAAKLSLADVQGVRDLHRAGFTFTSLAEAFNVCDRTIRNIIRGRRWSQLPDVPAPLPVLATDAASRLRIRSARKLTPDRRRQLDEYRRRLATALESEAEREGRAVRLLRQWTRQCDRTSHTARRGIGNLSG